MGWLINCYKWLSHGSYSRKNRVCTVSLTQLVASGEKQVCLSNIMQVELNSNFYHVSGYYILWNSSVSDIKIFVIWIFILVVSY